MANPNPQTEIKALVKERYGEIARKGASGCGTGCCGEGIGGVNFSQGYDDVAGYVADADLGLGCGLPTENGLIRPGETVLDLGSGAGNDAFIAARLAGDTGRVIGLDMTADMVSLARDNAARLGYGNVEFILGEIEAIPLPAATVDLVVSNCVLNLVPDKGRAFAEIHRVLRPGGRFAISDVVLEGELPVAVASAALAYVGCVAGALQEPDYLAAITEAGFGNVTIRDSRVIQLPAGLLQEVLGAAGASAFEASGTRIKSVTVTANR